MHAKIREKLILQHSYLYMHLADANVIMYAILTTNTWCSVDTVSIWPLSWFRDDVWVYLYVDNIDIVSSLDTSDKPS